MSAPRLTVSHYQSLIDLGWRRSGTTLYRPDLQRSCCPHYTIRLPASELHTSKHQRKSLSAWTRHVLGADFDSRAASMRPARSRAEKRAAQTARFDLGTAVHAPEASSLPDPSPVPRHSYEVTLEPDSFSEEKFALFEQYQRLVHHDKPSAISRRGFRSFLCGSPLVREMRVVNGREVRLGSFHQLHRLDGTLIALSVLDLLPHAVSAVYFIYRATPLPHAPSQPTQESGASTAPTESEPETTDFSAFSPGRLSALREALLADEMGLQFYYMGYYIHSCAKMRYKADFKPQYVLDPACPGRWDRLDSDGGSTGVAALLSSADAAESEGKGGFVSMSQHEQHEATKNSSEIPYPAPQLASAAPSIFALHLPGVPDLATLRATTDVGAIWLEYRKGDRPAPLGLFSRVMKQDEDEDVEEDGGPAGVSDETLDGQTLWGAVVEMAALVGLEVAGGMKVTFGG